MVAATATVIDDDAARVPCRAARSTLCLAGGRFRVSAAWHLADGTSGVGTASTLSDSSGTFWFFSPANVEMLVKVLDGCSVAGLEAYWIFVAATTDVGYRLEVVDTWSGITRQYVNRSGVPAAPIQDVQTFLACP